MFFNDNLTLVIATMGWKSVAKIQA